MKSSEGCNTFVTSQGRQSGSGVVNYDEEYSDDNRLSDADFDHVLPKDVAAEKFWKVKEESTGKHEDDLMESFKGLDFAHKEFEKEVQKWKDIGKDDPSIFDDSIEDMLELKDAKILELESALISGDAELQDLLKKIIQAEVEYVVITTTTKRLTEEPLCEIKHNLQRNYISSQEMQTTKKQGEKLETTEDVKKLHNRVCRLTLGAIIQLMLLLVTLFYLKFSPKSVEVVPT
uniref:uncharacterized protein LOC122600096 isoform X2 n=1 Tax=Erigeron canadensis TaxID=72917 RepID=UPI001CB9A640|nr:uncharacterized protein LOC122600096 isoform X2 [Erigeron canadensis]